MPIQNNNVFYLLSSLTDACSSGRWMKATSPSSMTLPTMSTWDNVYQNAGPQGLSPQMPPNVQHRMNMNSK